METGTLKELNVQPGDVVKWADGEKPERTIQGWCGGECYATDQELGGPIHLYSGATFRIISRATPAVDLTALTTPFGMLDDVHGPGTQDALRAHGGPYQRYADNGNWFAVDVPLWYLGDAYRVKPAPKRETVTRDMWADAETGLTYRDERPGTTPIRITVEKVDGKSDWSTHRVEAR